MSNAVHPWRVLVSGALTVVMAGALPAASSPHEPSYAQIGLYSDGVVLDPDGMPREVPVGDRDLADDPVRRAEQDAWLAHGTIPGPPEYADLAEQALRDLDALVLSGGAALAGASPGWQYVWPRDASFTAAALARTGHPQDAHAVLAYLQSMQDARSTAGVFEARYLPDGTGDVPDDRGLQLDGSGWVLWAVSQWYKATPAGSARAADLEALRPLVVRSVAAIRAHVDGDGLPFAFPDFWEVDVELPTLGTLAPLLLGVRAAAPLLAALDEPPASDLVVLLSRGLQEHFAPDYPRWLGGQDQDGAVAFLMPPFAPPDEEVRAAWLEAQAGMSRPAGGLAPGTGWRLDGVSWTPTTALFALTAAASGDVDLARERLDWLAAHRTERGSLPEKVLWDGSPSAVAPLAWTCALVLLALDELDRQSAA